MQYILLTALKDEEKYIVTLKNTVLRQNILPIKWVIIDSGSKDTSYKLAIEIFQNYPWISVIQQKKFYDVGYSHRNLAGAINEGYEYIKKICLESNVYYQFIGKTDATPVLSPQYFETLMKEMESDQKIAICCGSQVLYYHGSMIQIKQINNLPLTATNDIGLYRRDFFEAFHGFPYSPSPETVLKVKAIKNNWKVKLVETTFFVKPRLGGSKIGVWQGNVNKGTNMFVLGYHPLLMLLNSLTLTIFLPPHYQIVPNVYGYVKSLAQQQKKINDVDILQYYWHERLIELIKLILRR